MSELRQNLATKEWVVISTERGKKPNAVLHKITGTPVSDKDYDSECPFCPENEKRFPLEERYRRGHTAGNWAVRVIDNTFKILNRYATCPSVPDAFGREGIYQKLEGCGNHELVIDTSKPNRTITDLSREDLRTVIGVYLNRYSAFKKEPPLRTLRSPFLPLAHTDNAPHQDFRGLRKGDTHTGQHHTSRRISPYAAPIQNLLAAGRES